VLVWSVVQTSIISEMNSLWKMRSLVSNNNCAYCILELIAKTDSPEKKAGRDAPESAHDLTVATNALEPLTAETPGWIRLDASVRRRLARILVM